jgi:hypothetical protein
MTVLKASQLEADVAGVLDAAKECPQYIERDGTLLVITTAELATTKDDPRLSPWEQRAAAIESFYDPDKAW